MSHFIKFILCISLIFIFSLSVFAQNNGHVPSDERGDPKLRRKTQMEGNNIRATIFNYGHTGRTGGVPIYEETPYEWPKNSGKVYLAQTTILVGGEVIDEDDVKQHIVIVDNGRTSQDGRSWNFEPVPGYFNPNVESIANSIDPASWPDFWPDKMADEVDPGWSGSWNGYFGKNKFNADQEIYYRASDDRYDKYNYFPDSTDLTRHGLGIIMDVRVMAWSQFLVSDVIYILHTFKNDGTKDIEKFAVCVGIADFVGGDGDSNDDKSEFDLERDIMWSFDKDHRAMTFGNDPVGIVGVSLLETPGNALDRIDNDGDGEEFSPIITEAMIVGEDSTNFIDDNGNGLIDENRTHIAFGDQTGVGYMDGIDANGNGEENSPVITEEMVTHSQYDKWQRWPCNPEGDPIQSGLVHLLMVDPDDVGKGFKDNIDNNDNGEEGSPVITQTMIDSAASDDPYFRCKVPETGVILYDVKQEDLGKKYADGIDNDENGAIDEMIDEGIDEMIDEARDDGIDNDGDWDPISDDVGLDGVAGTGDFGENDGQPTSGKGTRFPGEPNIDVTDVSETDQIGITGAWRAAAGGGINLNSDGTVWQYLMQPGKFYIEALFGEYDLWVSSSYFPIRAGQSEPISMAVILANHTSQGEGDAPANARKEEVIKKRKRAQETYDNDYRFANAPISPKLTAIPGDNKVTLYWDFEAENSFDDYIYNIGGNPYDFEGYRIYRATDPAFQDPLNVTDAYGSLKFMTPIMIFDLKDGIKGLDSLSYEGAHFNLGNDTGLKHSWVDNSAKNGFTYYYAVTSYDFGALEFEIMPSECTIRINLKPDGSVSLGPNVARVTPEAPAAGFVPATLGNVELIEGSTTGKVFYEIIDPNIVSENDGHVYYITFEDTLKPGKNDKPDTLTTLCFTLYDSTADTTLIYRNRNMGPEYEQPLTDGFRLSFENEDIVELNKEKSKWTDANIPSFVFQKFVQSSPSAPQGQATTNDYKIIFDEVGFSRSTEIEYEGYTFPEKEVNFKVFDQKSEEFIDFGFVELDETNGGSGVFSAGYDSRGRARKDVIAFLEHDANDSLVFTWMFYLGSVPDSSQKIPAAGDTATIIIKKPFLLSDVFRFVASEEHINKAQAKIDIDNIKVVPNPYIAKAAWEPKNPYNSGRGPRSIHFTHLPANCTIRIFTISGELVDTIKHESPCENGTAYWDMLTKDNLSISYGVYIYHIDAPGVGEKIGKFAVIK